VSILGLIFILTPVTDHLPNTDSGSGEPAQQPALTGDQISPPKAPPAGSSSVEAQIHEVFGVHGRKAVRTFKCESKLNPAARSKSGRHLGIGQLGPAERARYGHGPDARTQLKAAHALFLERGWQPWAACL
jgi:hypothetical protein